MSPIGPMICGCGRSWAWALRPPAPTLRPPRTAASDTPERASARVAAVLRHGALSVQLSGRPHGAIAGRDAEPPHPRRRVLGPRRERLPAQRHVHVPAVLRWLPRLLAAARPGRDVPADPKPAPGPARPRQPAGARAAAVLRPRALPALPALPGRPSHRRRHGPRLGRP